MTIDVGQASAGAFATATSVTTVGIATAASGSSFVIFAIDDSSSRTVSDNKGNTAGYSQVGTTLTNWLGFGINLSIWLCTNGTGGAGHTATLTPGASADLEVYLVEVTGGATASLVDALSSAFWNDDAATPFTSNNVVTTNATDLLLAFTATDISLTETLTWGNSFTQVVADGNPGHFGGGIAKRLVTSTGTYNSSFTSNNSSQSATAVIALKTAQAAITPTQGALAFAGQSPTVANSGAPVPGKGSLAFAGVSSVLALGMSGAVGTASFTGFAPSISVVSGRTITPASGSLALTGVSAKQGVTNTPTVGTASWIGLQPNVSLNTAGGAITPNQADMAFVGYAVSQTLTLPPLVEADMAFVGYAPSLGGQALSIPTPANLAFTGYAPLVQFPTGVGSLSWQGQAVALTNTMGTTQGPLAFTGFAPTLSGSGLTIPATLSFTGQAPKVIGQVMLTPGTGTLTFNGNPLGLSYINPPTGSLSFTGLAPTFTNSSSRPATPRHYMQRFPVGTDGTVQCVDVTRAVPPFVFWNEIKVDTNGMMMIVVDGLPTGWDDGLQVNASECIVITRTPIAPMDWTNGLQLDSRGFLCVTDNPTLPVFSMQGMQFDVNGYLVVTIS